MSMLGVVGLTTESLFSVPIFDLVGWATVTGLSTDIEFLDTDTAAVLMPFLEEEEKDPVWFSSTGAPLIDFLIRLAGLLLSNVELIDLKMAIEDCLVMDAFPKLMSLRFMVCSII